MELYKQNEVKHYLDGHYISATEAAGRIFHFDTHGHYPSVT